MVRVGFSTSRNNPISWVIRKVTGSRTSHAWLLLEVQPFGQEMVLEASEFGVRLIPLDAFQRANAIVACFSPAHTLDQAMPEAGRWLGAAYDFGGLFGMAVVMLGRWLRRKWRNPWHSSRSLFCSELVVKVLEWAHHPALVQEGSARGVKRRRSGRVKTAAQTSPQDLLEFFEAEVAAGRASSVTLPAPGRRRLPA